MGSALECGWYTQWDSTEENAFPFPSRKELLARGGTLCPLSLVSPGSWDVFWFEPVQVFCLLSVSVSPYMQQSHKCYNSSQPLFDWILGSTKWQSISERKDRVPKSKRAGMKTTLLQIHQKQAQSEQFGWSWGVLAGQCVWDGRRKTECLEIYCTDKQRNVLRTKGRSEFI